MRAMNHGRRIQSLLGGIAASALIAAPVFGQDAAAHDEAAADDTTSFLRVAEEKGRTISLEIATRDYRPDVGAGPTITLMGVAHVGEREFYRALQKELAGFDLVLYESVLPAGANGASGEDDQQRAESTRAAMGFVAGLIETFRASKEAYPRDLSQLRDFATDLDARLGHWLGNAATDGWDRRLTYAVEDDGARYTLVSLGADGRVGGEGADADISLADLPTPQPLDFAGESDNIQVQLADALGMQFQLFALDYDHANWRCSDMAMDEVDRALAERDVEFELVSGALAGTSMFAKLAKVFLGFIRFADVLLEGAIADTMKVVMIEMLGDESMMQVSFAQFGAGFEEVIVDMRNQVVIDDVKDVVEGEPEVRSIAVLYGAAHMQDMAERLADQLGYAPAEARWYPAIVVDLERSVVSERDLRQMRMMMKQAMRMQMNAPRRDGR